MFASEVDCHVAIACGLTIVARLELGSRIPAFAFNAPDINAAKSRLAETIAVAFTGTVARDIDPFTAGSRLEERSNVRGDLLECAGMRALRMDDLHGVSLTSSTLETVLSSGTVSFRKQHRVYWPVTMLTGTGLRFSRSLNKRVLICHLSPQLPGTKHRRPGIDETIADRPKILRSALTLLCGRVRLVELGESPDLVGDPLGDWRETRRHVQGAIIDAGGPDIAAAYAAARQVADDEDPDNPVLEQLFNYTARCGAREWKAKSLVHNVENDGAAFPELRTELRKRLGVFGDERLTTQRVEPYLRRLAGKRLGGRQLVRFESDDRRVGALYSMTDMEVDEAAFIR